MRMCYSAPNIMNCVNIGSPVGLPYTKLDTIQHLGYAIIL